MGCYRDKQAGRFVNCRISNCNLSIFHSLKSGHFYYFFILLAASYFQQGAAVCTRAWAGWISAPAAGSPLMHDMDDNKDPRAREMEGYSEPVLACQAWSPPVSWAIGRAVERCALARGR